MKEGKNFKIFGVRSDLIGDTIMSLPILTYLEKKYPNSYKFFSILRKCSQSAPLYFNHPLIDKIVISDYDEGFGPTDDFYKNQCDLVLNTRPQHPRQWDWYNFRNIYEETWIMAGLPLEEFNSLSEEEKRPKLYPWFNLNKLPKTICYHAFAGYGDKLKNRSPSKEWSEGLIKKLLKLGYEVNRIGWHDEIPFDIDNVNYQDLRQEIPSFIEQIKFTLNHSLYIGTDSGFSLAVSAYNLIPQITLLSNLAFQNHYQNATALAPNGPKNINIFQPGGCSNIKHEQILNFIIQMFN